MKGFRLRNIVALFALVLLLAAVLVAHVYKQNTFVRYSKESVRLDKERKARRNALTLLEMRVGELRSQSRIEALAKSRFGLEYGHTPILVYPGGLALADRTPPGADGGPHGQ